jgi:hypothetical protein
MNPVTPSRFKRRLIFVSLLCGMGGIGAWIGIQSDRVVMNWTIPSGASDALRELHTIFEGIQLERLTHMPPESIPAEDWLLVLKKLGDITDPQVKAHRVQRVASVMNLRQVIECIRMIISMPEMGATDLVVQSLYKQWGRLDSRSAIQGLSALPEGWNQSAIERAIIEGWLETAPSAVVGYLSTEAKPSDYRDTMLVQLMQHWPLSALNTLWPVLNHISDPIMVYSLTDILIKSHMEQQHETALSREILDLPDNQFRAKAIEILVAEMTLRNPATTLRWASGLSAALDRSFVLKQCIQNWLMIENVSAIADHLRTYPMNEDYDGAVRLIALAFLNTDPANAFLWGMSIHNPEDRIEVLGMAGYDWLKKDSVEATAYISESTISEETKQFIFDFYRSSDAIDATPDEVVDESTTEER